MKEPDFVELIKDRAEYAEKGVHKGDIGILMMGERNGYILFFSTATNIKNPDGKIVLITPYGGRIQWNN